MRKTLFLTVLCLCLSALAFSEETESPSPTSLRRGIVQGTGVYFEVVDSEYLNVTLRSSEVIKLRLESLPELITMNIEPPSGSISTLITIGGLHPNTAYHKYEDNYHDHTEFTTDASGSYSFILNLSSPRHVWFQPRASTKYIRDDASGGDCTLIGVWDWATKTCTLTTHVYETIQIDNDYITIDGNGFIIIGAGTGFGIYLPRRTGVVIKNLNVWSFDYGIYLYSSTNNTLINNSASYNYYGVHLLNAGNNTLTGNRAVNGRYYGYGIYLDSSNNNTLANNTALNNYYFGIGLTHSHYNTLTNNTASNSEVIGIFFGASSNNTLINNTTSNNRWDAGIYLDLSSKNALINNNTSGNRWIGIRLVAASNNALTNNNISNNPYGILTYFSNENALTNEPLAKV